ncbi:MAG: D-alanine--D-alanine ligase [Planctomycetota bacterium]|nr:MAG: D-alanine--D-alanine ligase [Planctomycetota bacterium]
MVVVDVLMGGPGREREVSLKSGSAVTAALQASGYDARAVVVEQRLSLEDLRPGALVFNVIHGTYGEDGELQGQLDAWGRAYIGSDAVASRLCMDKTATRRRVSEAGLRIAWGAAIDPRNPASLRDLVPPTLTGLVVKPARDGSSVGLRFLPSKSFLLPTVEELVLELGPIPLLVEERLPGPEYTVAMVEQVPGEPRALPPIAICPAQGAYDYEAKYLRQDTRYQRVTDTALAAELQRRAEIAYGACGCRDFARIDFMAASDGDPCLLEINTLPGFTDHSLVPMAAAWSGMDFSALCQHLCSLALTRTAV